MMAETYKQWLEATFQTTVEQKYFPNIVWEYDELPSYGDLANYSARQIHPDGKFLEECHGYWYERPIYKTREDVCGCGCGITREACFFCGKIVGQTYERGKNGWQNKMRTACYDCYREGVDEARAAGLI
jgi:hypothetical protein